MANRGLSDAIAGVLREPCECCWGGKLAEAGCRLYLPKNGSKAILSGSKYQVNHAHETPLADALMFWVTGSANRVAIVELKSNNPSASKVVSQLQAGANLADSLADPDGELAFAAVLAKKSLSSIGYKALKGSRVEFRRKRYPVKVVKCGSPVAACF